ncbi:MAG TPA: zinc-dependent metalloprotease [Leptolyngbyaceae cyanobacterium]
MKRLLKFLCLFSLVLGAVLLSAQAWGTVPNKAGQSALSEQPLQSVKTEEITVEPASEQPPESKPEGLRPFDEVIDGLTTRKGLFTLYQNVEKNQAYLAIRPDQLSQNFLMVATLESGVGELGLLRGWPVSDLLVQFRRLPGNKVQLVVPNLYFRTAPNQPREQRLASESFSDSAIATLNIVSIEDKSKTILIDLAALILSRDPAELLVQYPEVFSSYSPNPDASYLEPIKAFPENIEIGAILGFSGGGNTDPLAALFAPYLESLPDDRGFNLKLRYSLSKLEGTPGYRPRLADERVGYFLTAFRNPAQTPTATPFVRYINRWHLEKQDPNAALSPAKEPIVFWIENTVPEAYQQPIREGILLWNTAFERAGLLKAIEVRQMPDDADWDPADIRYNVIRWSDSFNNPVVGLGPSRVNPLTGEILDADVVLDANVIRFLNQQYETYADPLSARAETYLQLCGHRLQNLYQQWLLADSGRLGDRSSMRSQTGQGTVEQPWQRSTPDPTDGCVGFNASQQLSFGGLALDLLGEPFTQPEALKTYVHQYLKSLTAHEVGHVLGLRHNFLGSTLRTPEELNKAEITHSSGLVGSVMDYFPPNLAPADVPQGDYFPTVLGPYDLWAIEYGYKVFNGLGPLPQMEQRSLQAIAERSSSAELAYATDEDIYSLLDPQADAWDLSSDPAQYAEWQLENAQALWKRLNWYSVRPGEGYGQLRHRFDLVFGYYLRQALTLSNYIGGQRFTRTDPWGSRGQRPFTPVPAEKQRQTLDLLQKYVFAPDAFEFSPDLLNSLAPDRWLQWGQEITVAPLDYPIYNRILLLQGLILSDMLNSDRLVRLRDSELKTSPGGALSLEELFDRVGKMVWTEVLDGFSEATSISSLRRGLQRHHLTILTNLVLRGYSGLDNAQGLLEFLGAATTVGAPEDARVLARYQLKQLSDAIASTLQHQGDRLSLTNRAHLEDVRDRIAKTLNAPLQGS